jgi:hypothetical protein
MGSALDAMATASHCQKLKGLMQGIEAVSDDHAAQIRLAAPLSPGHVPANRNRAATRRPVSVAAEVRPMEVIEALEPGMRENHAGIVGYPGFSGGLNPAIATCIAVVGTGWGLDCS